jgi:type IV secretion system protein VirB10
MAKNDRGQNDDHDLDGQAQDHGTETAPDDKHSDEAARETLVAKRRARQTGGANRRKRARLLMSVALLAGGAAVFGLIAGPSAAMKIFGVSDDDAQKTSQVNMKVDKEADQLPRLDFVVPEKPEPEKVDPMRDKMKALQDRLGQLERESQQEHSTLAAENAQLRAQAQRAEEDKRRAEDDKRRAEEAAKRQAADLEKSLKLDQQQRESKAVIVDQGDKSIVLAMRDGATPGNDRNNAYELNADERFLKSAASSVVQTSVSQKIKDPSRTVVQGTIISAVLETAIDSQLPGSIRAQVTDPVYSFDGSRVLMPSGTILIGQFDNNVQLEQERVLIAWNRAITPDGNSIQLGSTGTDTLGRAGTEGNVDNRYLTKFGAATLVSLITALPTALAAAAGSQSSNGTTVNVGTTAQVAGSVGNTASGQGSNMLSQYLSLPPIIRVPQGEEIRVFTNRDLIFR